MSNLFEILTGIKEKAQDGPLWKALTSQKPEMEAVQLDYNGQIDPQKSLALENQTKPLNLKERMFGRTLTKDVDNSTVNPETGEMQMSTERFTNTRPGIFNDISSGYQENRFNPISVNNFGQNTLDDGRQKGFAYRLGEGLGSLARFGESPLGRSLLVGGAIGALGGSPAEMLAYGASTGAQNQANRMADKLYRNQLEEQGIDTSNLRGYVNDNTFKNVSSIVQKMQKQQLDYDIKNAKNKTDAKNLVFKAWNNGLDGQSAQLLLQQIDNTFPNDIDLGESNATKKTDAQVEVMLNPDDYKKTSVVEYKGIPTNKTVTVNNTYTGLNNDPAKQQEYNNDLAEYTSISNGKDKDAKAYARATFIKKHGKDPDKLLNQGFYN